MIWSGLLPASAEIDSFSVLCRWSAAEFDELSENQRCCAFWGDEVIWPSTPVYLNFVELARLPGCFEMESYDHLFFLFLPKFQVFSIP